MMLRKFEHDPYNPWMKTTGVSVPPLERYTTRDVSWLEELNDSRSFCETVQHLHVCAVPGVVKMHFAVVNAKDRPLKICNQL